MTAKRTLFEAWHTVRYRTNAYSRECDNDGRYVLVWIQCDWEAWSAGWAAAEGVASDAAG